MTIFLSYAQGDKGWVEELLPLLQKEGLQIDSADTFPVGENWEEGLRQRIEAADLVVPLMTDKALRSSWVMFSYGAAKSARKPVLPLRVSGAPEPPPIPRFQTETFYWIEAPQEAAKIIHDYLAKRMVGV